MRFIIALFIFFLAGLKTFAQCSGPVTGLGASGITSSSAIISFTTPDAGVFFVIKYTDGVTNYRQNVNDPGPAYPKIVSSPITNLAENTEYTVTVMRYCTVTDSSESTSIDFTTLVGTCDSVTSPIVTTTNSTATETASEAAYGDSYIIQYVRQGQTDTAELTGADADFNLTGLKPSSNYYYRIGTICDDDTVYNSFRIFATKTSPAYTPLTNYGAQSNRLLAIKVLNFPAVNGEPSNTIDGKNDYPSLIEDTTNSELYIFNPKGQDYFKVGIDVVESITELKAHKLTPRRIFVMDSIRGGDFTLRNIPGLIADDGIYFNADSIGADYFWVRDVSQAEAIFADWWGLTAGVSADNSTKVQAAVNFVQQAGKGKLAFKRGGLYRFGGIVIDSNAVTIEGPGGFASSINSDYSVRLMLNTDSAFLFKFKSTYGITIKGLWLDGSTAATDDDGDGLVTENDAASTTIENCKFENFRRGIDAGGRSGWRVVYCAFRSCDIGIYDIRDSHLETNQFSSCNKAGIYINNGQDRIINNFFEFTGVNDRSNAIAAIYFEGNTNRLQILGNTFDRNLNYDIRGEGLGEDRATHIVIGGHNHFKRPAWDSTIVAGEQVACTFQHVDNIDFSDNDIIAQGYGAAGEEGLYSPRQAVAFDDCTQVMFKNNNVQTVKIKLDLANDNFTWIASASGTSEYYLRKTVIGPDSYNPWVGEPDYLGLDTVFYTGATAGALAVQQWDWADNDALGYNTIYIRAAGSVDPNTIGDDTLFAYYDNSYVTYGSSSDVQTDEFRDFKIFNLTDSTSSENYFYTRTRTASFRSNTYTLMIAGSYNSAGSSGVHYVTFRIRRITGTNAARAEILDINSASADFTVGTDATADLQIEIMPDALGTRAKIRYYNHSVNTLNLTTGLLW